MTWRKTLSFLSRWPATLAVAAVILALSRIPPDDLPSVPLFPGADKIIHLMEYLVLGALLFRSMAYDFSGNPVWVAIIALVAGAWFGALDEWQQGFFGRTPDLRDWVADVLGVVLGIAWVFFVNRLKSGDAQYGS
jgi:VanZ family protein